MSKSDSTLQPEVVKKHLTLSTCQKGSFLSCPSPHCTAPTHRCDDDLLFKGLVSCAWSCTCLTLSAGANDTLRFSPSLSGAPDLPGWLAYGYSTHRRSGAIYGVPPPHLNMFKVRFRRPPPARAERTSRAILRLSSLAFC